MSLGLRVWKRENCRDSRKIVVNFFAILVQNEILRDKFTYNFGKLLVN